MNNSKIFVVFYYNYSTNHKIQIKKLFKDAFDIPNHGIIQRTIIISYLYQNYVVAMNCLLTTEDFAKKNNSSNNNEGIFMYNLCVMKSFQGLGIGKTLMEKTIWFVNHIGRKTLTLQVYDDNKKAINLYTKMNMKKMNSGMDPITKKSMTTYFRWCD